MTKRAPCGNAGGPLRAQIDRCCAVSERRLLVIVPRRLWMVWYGSKPLLACAYDAALHSGVKLNLRKEEGARVRPECTSSLPEFQLVPQEAVAIYHVEFGFCEPAAERRLRNL